MWSVLTPYKCLVRLGDRSLFVAAAETPATALTVRRSWLGIGPRSSALECLTLRRARLSSGISLLSLRRVLVQSTEFRDGEKGVGARAANITALTTPTFVELLLIQKVTTTTGRFPGTGIVDCFGIVLVVAWNTYLVRGSRTL
jgi:hypothetical protein